MVDAPVSGLKTIRFMQIDPEMKLAAAVIYAAIQDARGDDAADQERQVSAVAFLDGGGMAELWFALIAPPDRDPVEIREQARRLALEGQNDDRR